jgi:hypothetical protein
MESSPDGSDMLDAYIHAGEEMLHYRCPLPLISHISTRHFWIKRRERKGEVFVLDTKCQYLSTVGMWNKWGRYRGDNRYHTYPPQYEPPTTFIYTYCM